MTHQELQELRKQKWRVAGEPIRTLEDGQAFLEANGFALMYPVTPPLPVPTFMGAYAGTEDGLPTAQTAFADPRATEATDLMVRLLRDRSAYEANLFTETNFLVSASVFPFFYGLVGDRNPKNMPKPGTRSEYSTLARDAFEAIRKHGPISKMQLAERLGGALSDTALDRALGELWSRLRITRVNYVPGEGAFWDVLFRWSPDAVKEGIEFSVPEALSALVSKYVDAMIAVEASEVEGFFSHMVARAKTRDAINALLAARELTLVHVGNRSMLQIAGAQVPSRSEITLERNKPIARRPRMGVRPK